MSLESIRERVTEWDGEVVPDEYRDNLLAFAQAVSDATRDRKSLLAVAEAAKAWMEHEVEFGPAGVPYYVYTGPSSKHINAIRAALAALEAQP